MDGHPVHAVRNVLFVGYADSAVEVFPLLLPGRAFAYRQGPADQRLLLNETVIPSFSKGISIITNDVFIRKTSKYFTLRRLVQINLF